MHRPASLLLILLATVVPVLAADTRATTDTSSGDRVIDAYFRSETRRLAERCLADITSLDDWKARRGEYREQLFEMICDDLMPPVIRDACIDKASPWHNLFLPKFRILCFPCFSDDA